MHQEAIEALLDSVCSYYNLYVRQLHKRDHTKSKMDIAPSYLIAILDYLKERGYTFDFASAQFTRDNQLQNTNAFTSHRDIQHALRELSKDF